MLNNISRRQLLTAWFAIVVIAIAVSVVAGPVPSLSTVALLLMASVMPPAVFLMVFRGAPPLSVAELLHEVDSKDGR